MPKHRKAMICMMKESPRNHCACGGGSERFRSKRGSEQTTQLFAARVRTIMASLRMSVRKARHAVGGSGALMLSHRCRAESLGCMCRSSRGLHEGMPRSDDGSTTGRGDMDRPLRIVDSVFEKRCRSFGARALCAEAPADADVHV